MTYQPKRMYLTHFGMIEPTPQFVEQLIQAVKDIKQIALDAKEITENRVKHMQEQLTTHVLNKLAEMKCEQSVEYQREKMANDLKLNAQGMDVWLNKLAKEI